MKSALRYILFGIGVWLVPFAIGVAIFPLVPPEAALFDTLMSVAMAASASGIGWQYLRQLERVDFGSGALIGLGWAAICIAADAPLFLFGQFLMPPADYFADIGLTYLMIPAITGFIGLALREKTSA